MANAIDEATINTVTKETGIHDTNVEREYISCLRFSNELLSKRRTIPLTRVGVSERFEDLPKNLFNTPRKLIAINYFNNVSANVIEDLGQEFLEELILLDADVRFLRTSSSRAELVNRLWNHPELWEKLVKDDETYSTVAQRDLVPRIARLYIRDLEDLLNRAGLWL